MSTKYVEETTAIPTNVRTRANDLLRDRELPPIGHLTPHTLRRTFASLLAEVGCRPAGRCTSSGTRTRR
jgi:integrase